MSARFLLGLAIAFAAQAGIVGAMVWSRASVLQNGPEIAVRSTFVDPRDIFRGHYVALNLTIDPPEDELPGFTRELWEGGTAYVTLREGEDGFWVAKALHEDFPDGSPDPVLEAVQILPPSDSSGRVRIVLPFDRYFANYDRAQELENLRREQKLGVVLALDGAGGAVIKGLTIDGIRVHDESLF